MKTTHLYLIPLLALLLIISAAGPSNAAITFQCPTLNGGKIKGDLNGDGMIRADDNEITKPVDPQQVCMHLAAGDGFTSMAELAAGERVRQYIFGFANVTHIKDGDVAQKNGDLSDDIMQAGALAAEWPAPGIVLKENDAFFLTLSNVGMQMRPDLFDPHTVHYHGYPEATNIYDGLPESGIAINMGASLTYYYKNHFPGTYMYHCHVEATEHMQMGMLGNLYMLPAQNELAQGTDLNGFAHQNGNRYVYNDGDGSTRYDAEFSIQLGGFDKDFHDASESVAPLPFADMWDDYPMINGRGYPDTADPGDLPAPAGANPLDGNSVQRASALIEIPAGQRALLRISNLNVTRFHTIATSGIPMLVVGKDARLLRAADPDGDGPLLGENLSYLTSSVTLGGGESYDVILDTAGLAAGETYFLYSTNLNLLSNNEEDYGGMMTEIHIQ